MVTNGTSLVQTVDAEPMSSVWGSVVVVVDEVDGGVEDVVGEGVVVGEVGDVVDDGGELVVVVAADDDVVDAGCVVDVDVLDVAGVDDDVLVDVVTPWVLGTQSGHVDVVGELVVGYVVVVVGQGPPHIGRVSGFVVMPVATAETPETVATSTPAAMMAGSFM
jgi:hypothetical protein